ncbi:MAG: hypothetical protein QN137_10555 [Armatimonadota bacterium]|nr:hypothetical protein [Armatimonadota bacterium]
MAGLVAGTLVGLAGSVAWVVGSVGVGVACGVRKLAGAPSVRTADDVALRAGFAAMVLGPLVGWVVVPALGIRRRWVRLPLLALAATLGAVVVSVVVAVRPCR